MGEWSFLVGFTTALLVYFGLDALGKMAGPWVWIERFSWLAGIAALIASLGTIAIAVWLGLPQLRQIRAEQQRLADEQARRPDLRVGFDAADPYDLSIPQQITV